MCCASWVQSQTDPFSNKQMFSFYKFADGFVYDLTVGPDGLPYWVTPAYGAKASDRDVILHKVCACPGRVVVVNWWCPYTRMPVCRGPVCPCTLLPSYPPNPPTLPTSHQPALLSSYPPTLLPSCPRATQDSHWRERSLITGGKVANKLQMGDKGTGIGPEVEKIPGYRWIEPPTVVRAMLCRVHAIADGVGVGLSLPSRSLTPLVVRVRSLSPRRCRCVGRRLVDVPGAVPQRESRCPAQ